MHVFKEGNAFVAYSRMLERVQGFLEAAEAKGTINEILEERVTSGSDLNWKAPEFVGLDRMTTTF